MPFSRRLGLLLLTTAALAACAKKKDGAIPPRAGTDAAGGGDTNRVSSLALPVVGEEVRKGDLVLTVTATGQIRTDATTSVKAESQGTVEEVMIRAGDKVKKGQPLARIDTVGLHLDLLSAEAALNQAWQNYHAEIDPDSLSGRMPTEAQRKFKMSHSGVETAQINLQKAKLALAKSVVYAPYDAVVEKVSMAVGDRIGSGAEVCVVVDLNNLRVEAQVLEHDLPLLRIGGDAIITIAALPTKPVHGTIAALLPLVDSATKMGRAQVRLKGDGMIRPGMYTDIKLEANRLHNRVIVPKKAVIERDGRPLVFVFSEGHANWVYINPGRANDREIEILPDTATGQIPLKPGDIVLTEGHLTLTHQAPVKLIAKKEGDSQ